MNVKSLDMVKESIKGILALLGSGIMAALTYILGPSGHVLISILTMTGCLALLSAAVVQLIVVNLIAAWKIEKRL